MKILLVAATSYELTGILDYLDKKARKVSFFEYELNSNHIFPMVLGVGSFMTGYGMAKSPTKGMDMAIQIGIGGSFDKSLELGTVVEVSTDQFADIGVSEADGRFTSAFDLGLIDANTFPFSNEIVTANNKNLSVSAPKVHGITVNRVTGTEDEIVQIRQKYPNAVCESMEGAAFLYACRMLDLPGTQLRSISNYIEPRNRDNWKVELALERVSGYVVEILER